MVQYVQGQKEVEVDGRSYRLDFEIAGSERRIAVELDGFEFHSSRPAFSYDRLRQNDIQATGRIVVRFSYDSIRLDTARCVAQLQAVLRMDPLLAQLVIADPVIERPQMDPDPLRGLLSTFQTMPAADGSYFDSVRDKLNQKTLRDCQTQAFAALANYYLDGGRRSGLRHVGRRRQDRARGVRASLAFTERRAMVVTPGSVIRGTFDSAFDHEAVGNVLYGLPGGPLIPGCRPPQVLTLDRDETPIRAVTRDELLAPTSSSPTSTRSAPVRTRTTCSAKLDPDDIDFIVVDEAHIAAAESYQRAFAHFAGAREAADVGVLSAARRPAHRRRRRLPLPADRLDRPTATRRTCACSASLPRRPDDLRDGLARRRREEIVGREAILELIADERKLARITAKSNEPIRQVMRTVRRRSIARPSCSTRSSPAFCSRPSASATPSRSRASRPSTASRPQHLHHSMTERQITAIRERFEHDSGDLQGLVQLKMLGQGYDFPPICVVVPMRPYGSFSEFYQFIGRGIRVLTHPGATGRVGPGEQFLDVVYHAELGLDEHIDTIYAENDMDPITEHVVPDDWGRAGAVVNWPGPPAENGRTARGVRSLRARRHRAARGSRRSADGAAAPRAGARGTRPALRRLRARRTEDPVSFEQFANIIEQLGE